jgi:hypothetical protein
MHKKWTLDTLSLQEVGGLETYCAVTVEVVIRMFTIGRAWIHRRITGIAAMPSPATSDARPSQSQTKLQDASTELSKRKEECRSHLDTNQDHAELGQESNLTQNFLSSSVKEHSSEWPFHTDATYS